MKATVFGAGGWGTALATVLAEKHDRVKLYVRNAQQAERIRRERENAAYLPGVPIPPQVFVCGDAGEALRETELLVLATPSHGVREAAKIVAPLLPSGCVLVSVAKGLELDTCLRMTEVLAEEIPAAKNRLVVLSGPNHAEEVGRKLPSASVAASVDADLAEVVQDAFMTSAFRIYANFDVIGVELGGALKNIVAIGAGIAEGLGFGDNAKAALMTRGLAEIARLGVACGASSATFSRIGGIGRFDCHLHQRSQQESSGRAGHCPGARSAAKIRRGRAWWSKASGLLRLPWRLSRRLGVEMPITEALYQVLYQEQSAAGGSA